MSMIYLAARFSRRYERQGYRADLQRAGHIVTSHWIDLNEENEADAANCARIDIENLDAADTVIALGDVARSNASRGGHHFEAGYALASGHRILLVGHREHVFSYLPEIEFHPNWESCLATLKAERPKLAA
jgi:nucleoside 2-deoxyribosyltransferase